MTTYNDPGTHNSRHCAKCGSSDVLFVEAIQGNFGSGNVIPLSGMFIWSSVKVDRFVCMSCGFCEEWIMNPDDREHLRRWYRPGSPRTRNNDRWRRWGESVAKLKRRLFGGGGIDQSTHNPD